jgi:hypothetical protein
MPAAVWLRTGVFTVLFCWRLPTAGGVVAQQKQVPFGTVDLSIELLGDVHRGTFQRDWSTGATLGARAALPFYAGTVELGAQLAHPSPRRAGLPDFRSLFVFAGWSGTRPLGPALRGEVGVRAGLVGLSFDVDTLADFRRHEREPALAVRAALRWAPRGSWFVEGAAAWQSVFTRPAIEQVFLSGAVGHRFRTPTWLRNFLD